MPVTRPARRLGAALLCLQSAAATDAAPAVPEHVSAGALGILKRSIGFRTELGAAQVPAYAAYLSGVLQEGGFAAPDIDIQPFGETATMTARYRGTDPDAAPILIAAHMDVVTARPEDWERDPYTAVVEDGFVFGRGATDNKFGIAMMASALLWLKEEGFRPRRDIVLVLSGDEETSQDSTAKLADQWKHAWLFLNSDAGGAQLDDEGRPVLYTMQAAEKTYMDFALSFANPGGHSSRPSADNAIYRLARALGRIAAFRFPARHSELTRAYFRAAGALRDDATSRAMLRYAEDADDREAYETIAAQPEYVGQLGTTCVATLLEGGHAPNALPQNATANINCRVFPGESVESVRETLWRVVDDPTARLAVVGEPVPSDASPLRGDVMAALRRAIDERAPGLPIVPAMSAGATDGLYFRNVGVPSYGVGGIFIHPKDSFAHGLNERVPVASIDGALRQWRRLLRELAR